MHLNSALDHRDCPTVAVVESDDYPLGEHPPVAWWQVQNVPYAVVEFITPIAISVTEAMLDLISIALLGKPWSELVDDRPWPWSEWLT
ncbi:hypothetical protein [Mycobacteroides abscessus]|uniref:hypothetical protein n=1 Tax=Mycobacteroides abscessus TaxID=36809 RepID=UPI00092A1CFB|nr:hypothetical protein [Mycobacteroides abscessus]SIM00193.1 Uncharacterised protein [Mycobacteroides abscessus subsp. abscessus]